MALFVYSYEVIFRKYSKLLALFPEFTGKKCRACDVASFGVIRLQFLSQVRLWQTRKLRHFSVTSQNQSHLTNFQLDFNQIFTGDVKLWKEKVVQFHVVTLLPLFVLQLSRTC